jgi:TolB protein
MKRFIGFVAAVTAALVVLVVAEPARATVHGKNGRIAFRRYFNSAHTHGAIFTINPDGTGIRQITLPRKGVLDTQPDWSPSGRWIAFERISPHKVRLFKVRADGSDLTLLLQGPCGNNGCATDEDPGWSPSGKQIAFDRSYGPVVNGAVAHVGLFVMDVDGTHVRQLTEAVTPTKYEDTSPQWSPDGTRLVFDRLNKATDRRAVFTVQLDGTHPLRLSPWSLDAGGNPDWSPDGRWILFQSHEPHDRQDNLYLVHPNGKNLHRITHTFGGTYTWFKQSFSPDGTMIAVARGPGLGAAGNPDVYVMNLDGSGLRDVTNSLAWDSATDWGPSPR